MAKKKEDIEEVIVNDIERLQKDMKDYADVLIDATIVLDQPETITGICPAIDPIIGGGIPEGSWFVVTGPPKYGKTTLILTFCANAQKEENDGRDVYYLDIENRLKKMNLEGIPGLNLNKFKIIRSTPSKILTAEMFFDIGLKILTNCPKSILVIDSIGALLGENENVKGMDEATMGGTSIAQSRFIRKAGPIVRVNKNIVVAVTHRTANLSGYGASMREKTSNSLAYQCDVKLAANKIEKWVVGTKQIGQIVTWETMVSALGQPGGVAQSYIRYGKGIDKLTELIVIAKDLDILKLAGVWYLFEYQGQEMKLQGLEKTYQFFAEDSDAQDWLDRQVRELLY